MKTKQYMRQIKPLIIISLAAAVILFSINTGCQNTPAVSPHEGAESEAYFAGGCFWCIEADFEKVPGVTDVISGYSGGTGDNPTYANYGDTGHIEVVRVRYDAGKVSYPKLLTHFWTHIDPLDGGGQFCDRGRGYVPAVFYRNPEEKKLAEESLRKVERALGEKVNTLVLEFEKFWKAEEYHQDYYKKNPIRYRYYRLNCGRDRRVNEVWQGKKPEL